MRGARLRFDLLSSTAGSVKLTSARWVGVEENIGVGGACTKCVAVYQLSWAYLGLPIDQKIGELTANIRVTGIWGVDP